MTRPSSLETERRRRWMGVLAHACVEELETFWQGLDEQPGYRMLRRPEIGMALVRGCAGGTGERFNLGEMTMVRCVVQLEDGITGYAYVAGRNRRCAELAAVFDALLQQPARRRHLEQAVIEPLIERRRTREARQAARAAATRVEFFTLVRGDD